MALQNHIHMSLVSEIDEGPELAPANKFKVMQDGWSPEYETVASFDRAWTGRSFFSSIVDDEGAPRMFKGFRYVLRVNKDELDILEALLLQHVVLCDNYHADDGEDHTNDILHMRFMAMDYNKSFSPRLTYHFVIVVLVPEDEGDA